MLIEALEGLPVRINGSPFCRNLRMNVNAENRQIRLKAELLQDDKVTPIDIVVLNYTDPTIGYGMSFNTIVEGRDMIRNISFRLRVSCNIISKQINVTGSCGRDHVSAHLDKKSGDFHMQLLSLFKQLCGI